MAEPKVAFGTKMRIKLSDGEVSPTYELICGLTAKSVTFSKEMNDFTVPDCDDPDKIVAVKRRARTKAMEVSGSGVYVTDDRERIEEWFADEEPRAARIEIDVPLADGGGRWQGDFHLSNHVVTGNDEDLIQAEMTILSDGEWEWVDAAP